MEERTDYWWEGVVAVWDCTCVIMCLLDELAMADRFAVFLLSLIVAGTCKALGLELVK